MSLVIALALAAACTVTPGGGTTTSTPSGGASTTTEAPTATTPTTTPAATTTTAPPATITGCGDNRNRECVPGQTIYGVSDNNAFRFDGHAYGAELPIAPYAVRSMYPTNPGSPPFQPSWARLVLYPCQNDVIYVNDVDWPASIPDLGRKGSNDLRWVEQWVREVRAAGFEPVVSPEWRSSERRCPGGTNDVDYWDHMAQWHSQLYAAGLRYWTTVNEPDHKNYEGTSAPKLDPDLLAQTQIWQQSAILTTCPSDCHLITGEFASLEGTGKTYAETFAGRLSEWITLMRGVYPGTAVRYPLVWSLHDYGDTSKVNADCTWTYPDAGQSDYRVFINRVANLARPYVKAEYGASTDSQIWVTEAGTVLEQRGNATNLAKCGLEGGGVFRFLVLGSHPQVSHVFWHAWVGKQELNEEWDSGVLVGVRHAGEDDPYAYLRRSTYCSLNGQTPTGFGDCAGSVPGP